MYKSNDFPTDKAFADSPEIQAVFIKLYQTRYSGCSPEKPTTDYDMIGVDKKIFLVGQTKPLLIEEKARRIRKDGKVFDDLLVERWSNSKAGTRGWSFDTRKVSELLYYYIKSVNKCYIIDAKKLLAICLKYENRITNTRQIKCESSHAICHAIPWDILQNVYWLQEYPGQKAYEEIDNCCA